MSRAFWRGVLVVVGIGLLLHVAFGLATVLVVFAMTSALLFAGGYVAGWLD